MTDAQIAGAVCGNKSCSCGNIFLQGYLLIDSPWRLSVCCDNEMWRGVSLFSCVAELSSALYYVVQHVQTEIKN